MEGNLRFKIDWDSLIVGSKFTIFALFYFVFEGNFQVQAPGDLIFGGAIWRRVFCVTSVGGLYLEGLKHGGAYFLNFMVYPGKMKIKRWISDEVQISEPRNDEILINVKKIINLSFVANNQQQKLKQLGLDCSKTLPLTKYYTFARHDEMVIFLVN